jgi:hypothetical protein
MMGQHRFTTIGAFGRIGCGVLLVGTALIPFGFRGFTFWQSHEQSPNIL